jgi:hypothetical protein
LRSTRWKQDAFGQVNMVGSGSVNIAVLIPTNISCPSYWYWLPASMVYQLSTQPPPISIIQDNHGSETSKKQGYSGAFYSFLDVFGANLHGNLLRTHRSLLPGSDWVCAAADQLGWTPIRREKCDENPVENPVDSERLRWSSPQSPGSTSTPSFNTCQPQKMMGMKIVIYIYTIYILYILYKYYIYIIYIYYIYIGMMYSF